MNLGGVGSAAAAVLTIGTPGSWTNLGGTCYLLHAASLFVPQVTTAAGTATVPMPIPGNPAFAGLVFTFQWGAADPQARSVYGVAVSNLGALRL